MNHGSPIPALTAATRLALVAALVWVPSGCSSENKTHTGPAVSYEYLEGARGHQPIAPLPRIVVHRPDVVALGARLFDDPRLSADETVSCSTCHVLSEGGDDGLPRSIGINGGEGGINTPSVLNSGLNVAQFWDGRARTLEDQVDGPVTHPDEMGANWTGVVSRIAADPEYAYQFQRAFGAAGITPATIRSAIAAFERSLIAASSPFDRWLLGDDDAISKEAREGYSLFKSAGCVTCHQGRNIGGNMFQRFGVLGDYFADRGELTKADHGRFNVTGDERDRQVFRVPSLRNVAQTAPYFHDASAATLEDAVNIMATYQLGRLLDSDQVFKIVAFLRSLSGKVPKSSDAKNTPLARADVGSGGDQ